MYLYSLQIKGDSEKKNFDGKTSQIVAVIIAAHEATQHLPAKFTISSTVSGE
jgi:hypothetical protein